MQVSNITLAQLKQSGYEGRHGFVFEGSAPVEDTNVTRTCEILIEHDFVAVMPEIVFRLDERTFVFVYPEGVSFVMPAFIQYCDYWSERTQAFGVDTLHNLLNNQEL